MSAYAYPLLIKQLLITPLAQASRHEIVYRDRIRYDYQTLNSRIAQFAHVLTRHGIGPGDTVAVLDWDSHRYLEAFFAVPMVGARLMTANIRLAPEYLAYTLHHCGAKLLLCNADFLPLLANCLALLGPGKPVILLVDEQEVRPEEWPDGYDQRGEYENLLAAEDTCFAFADFDENTPATTFYTTGTTGLPKGVEFTHRQIVLHTLATLATLAMTSTNGRLSRDDAYMPITPMFHVHAWGLPYVATMAGMKQVFPGRYQAERLLQLIASEAVTFSHCVPTVLQMLLTAPESRNYNLRHWKVLIGGSSLPRPLAKAALDRGIDVFVGYGMSETCPMLSISHLKEDVMGSTDTELDYRLKAGLVVPLVDLRIVDGDMQDTPHDGESVGEVIARAPWLTMSYVGNPAAGAELWRGGYLHTGDLGTIDPLGYLTITDRVKDAIKSGGEWVSSLALEDIIARHPSVAEVAVIARPDERWGERPVALIVLRPGGDADAEILIMHVQSFVEQGVLSRFAVPKEILFVDHLIRTSVGKLDKKTMREHLEKMTP